MQTFGFQKKYTQLQAKRNYYTQRIQQPKFQSYKLNVGLSSNPFIRDQQSFHYLVYCLNQFNRRIDENQVTDPYQHMSFEKLLSALADLALMETREDQLIRLEEVFKWWKQQQRLILQRKYQGQIKYRLPRKYQLIEQEPKENSQIEAKQNEIPTEMKQRILGPYAKNRTMHKQLQIPLVRLNQYKRKIINIAPFIETREQAKPQRVLYPMPVKVQQPKQQQQQPKQGQQKEGQQKQGDKGGQIPPVQGQKQVPQGQDLGGFGQEPQEPDQDQPPQQDNGDKLAPKVKAYTAAIENTKRKYYRGPYMHYFGQQKLAERNMQQRILNLQEDKIRQQKQQQQQMSTAHQWGRKKSKMQKQLQKKLQQMTMRQKYLYSKEEPPAIQRLNPQDQLKYGFTMPLKTNKFRRGSFDLASVKFPKLSDEEPFKQKSFRKDRLNSLKNKFGKLLNITEFQDRQSASSMCQYTTRRRGLSEIIQNHSKSKQRLHQLEQVTKIKERLTRNKLGINIKTLSQGLCLPQQQTTEDDSKIFADKMLPSNPFMIQPKKKKKK